MTRISYDELRTKLMNVDVPDEDIAKYLKFVPEDSGPFDPRVEPNPELVEMDATARFQVESAMKWGNSISRWRRQTRFSQRLANGVDTPVLVSEGDSWQQFPFFIQDIIDHLDKDYLIWSLDAAGDTAENMVNSPSSEYFRALVEQKANNVAGFLFSGAGNDVIGEDVTGKPVLSGLLRPFDPNKSAAQHIDMVRLGKVLQFLDFTYRRLIQTIRSDPDFVRLPIFFHGYDYVIPGGQPGDPRTPLWAKQNEWLGEPMTAKGIVNPTLQREILHILIDALYDMLEQVGGDSAQTRVYVVNVRDTLTGITDWADEIHGTSAGFGKVAAKFHATIAAAINA
jgi:hypothetical protein